MKTNIQFVQMAHSPTMQSFVESKLEKLYNKYGWIIKTDVAFRQENDPKGKGKICSMELSMPGPRIFASSKESNFELAATETIRDLTVQIKKRKATMITHL